MRASYTYGNKRSARSVSASLRARYFSPLANNNCAWMVACLVRTCRRSASRNSPFVSRGSLSSKILRVAISTRPMTAPAASSAASLGTSAGRGSSILVCSLSVSFAANAAGAIAAVRTVNAIRHSPPTRLIRPTVYRAASSLSPVRMRKTRRMSVTKILPSPTFPVFEAPTMASIT